MGQLDFGELGQKSNGAMVQWTIGQWTSEKWSRGQWKMSQWTMGQWDDRTVGKSSGGQSTNEQ
jgi:hypothetical protein